jgi:hypothetical protein
MATHKPRKSAESKSHRAAGAAATPKGMPGRKVWLGILGGVIVLYTAWIAVHRLNEGPKTPLPRQAAAVSFGQSFDQVKAIVPQAELHPYNNDPDFKIASLKKAEELPAGLTGLDLIFYQGSLFFISQQWEQPDGQKDLDAWAKTYRRWLKEGGGKLQSLGDGATLREWYFQDTGTEMILRELKFKDRTEHWQDIRDGANQEAQKAFAKYRIDG